MHQATHAEQSTLEAHGAALPGPAPLNAFVINLCSSTSPVALTPPDHAGLKRFSFFVSRRREESRERFRLHMGYFDTQEEAEKLLDIVREIYPGAWAGLAPGHRLRAAAAQGHAAETALIATEVAPAQLEAPLDAQPAAAAQSPTTLATPPAAQSIPATDPAAATIAAPVVGDAAVSGSSAAAESAAAEAAAVAALALVPDQGRRLPQDQAGKPEHAAARSLNDVRAAIASLEDTSERAPVLRPIPELKPAAGAPISPVAVRGSVAPQQTAAEISARGVLERGARTAAAVGKSTSSDARSPAGAPQEVQPLPEKPCYAVQLMWSVQPMDIAQVPQLAIFSAYTLYGAEGNRDGRRWYGLRLGFFTDAVSAKQVAHYVRSEFSTVSVVPVTARERERAHLASGRPAVAAPAKGAAPAQVAAPAHVAAPPHPAATPTPPRTKFEFIEDRDLTPALGTKPGSGSAGPARSAPGKRAKLRTQSGVNGRSRTKPMTLEETLEILGAGELKMDDGRQPLINDSGVGRVKPAKNKSSRLGRLFERLSERMGS